MITHTSRSSAPEPNYPLKARREKSALVPRTCSRLRQSGGTSRAAMQCPFAKALCCGNGGSPISKGCSTFEAIVRARARLVPTRTLMKSSMFLRARPPNASELLNLRRSARVLLALRFLFRAENIHSELEALTRDFGKITFSDGTRCNQACDTPTGPSRGTSFVIKHSCYFESAVSHGENMLQRDCDNFEWEIRIQLKRMASDMLNHRRIKPKHRIMKMLSYHRLSISSLRSQSSSYPHFPDKSRSPG